MLVTGAVLIAVCTSFAAGAVTNFADVACGRLPRRAKIIGGLEASPGEFPWIVSITKRGGHFCGGTIINNRWVLTAAHCLCSGDSVLGAGELKVRVGGHDLRHAPGQVLPVASLLIHPNYVCSKYLNDIALLELGGEVVWSDRVGPACLPSPPTQTFSNVAAVVAGWGWTAELTANGGRANVLQKVDLTVVGNDQCKSWYKSMGKKVKIHDSQMCAGVEQGGKDSCWADSGGPLMVGGETDSPLVVGIVSTGIGCARPKLPGLYTRISDYLPWIKHTLLTRR